jgi:hypothetical protein
LMRLTVPQRGRLCHCGLRMMGDDAEMEHSCLSCNTSVLPPFVQSGSVTRRMPKLGASMSSMTRTTSPVGVPNVCVLLSVSQWCVVAFRHLDPMV